MLNADSSTTVSGERGPTPRKSTMTCPRPTTQSLAGAGSSVMPSKLSRPGRGPRVEGVAGRVGRREHRSLQDALRPDEPLQGVDGLAVGRAGVVGTAQVVEDLGP